MATEGEVQVVNAGSPAKFTFARSGGAIMHARLDVWGGVGTPDEKRLFVLFFEDSLDQNETFTRSLPSGTYSCVFKVFVVVDLNGVFDWQHSVDQKQVLFASGDVKADPSQGGFRDEYVLVVA